MQKDHKFERCAAEQRACPVPRAHKRLSDAHRLWHEAERGYFEPDLFVINLNACITALRSVTFILQKEKRVIPRFDSWYGPWQDRMRQDPIMKWLVTARNRIEKQGDLETRSVLRLTLVADWIEQPYWECDAPPLSPLEGLPKFVADKAKGPPEGVMKLERRWVAEDLPETELLDALGHAYGVLACVIDDVHTHVGIPGSRISRLCKKGQIEPLGLRATDLEGRLPCMVVPAEHRTLWIDVPTGEPIDLELVSKQLAPGGEQRVREHYGETLVERFGRTNTDDFESLCRWYFEAARSVFEKDGFHNSYAFTFRGGTIVGIFRLTPESRRDKFLEWEGVAIQVAKTGVDTVIAIGEAWLATHSSGQPLVAPSDDPDRKEILFLDALTKDGQALTFSAVIERKNGAVRLGDTKTWPHEGESTALYLEPVRRVWRADAWPPRGGVPTG